MSDDEDTREVKKPQRQPSERRDSIPHGAVMSPALPASSPALSRSPSLDQEREPSIGPEGSRKILRIKRLVRWIPNPLGPVTDKGLGDNRSMGNGERRSYVTPGSFALMCEVDKPLRRKPPWQIAWRPQETQIRISARRRGD